MRLFDTEVAAELSIAYFLEAYDDSARQALTLAPLKRGKGWIVTGKVERRLIDCHPGLPRRYVDIFGKPIGVTALTVRGERAPRPESKRAKCLRLLMQPEGATVQELHEALGWSPALCMCLVYDLRAETGTALASEGKKNLRRLWLKPKK